jgi:hypothetical protein
MQIEQYLILFGLLILHASYTLFRVKNRIHCELIRKDGTSVQGWATYTMQRIALDNGWYYLDTDRIVHELWDKGWPFIAFPTRGDKLYFRFNSDRPLDPKTFTNSWPTPDARKMLDKSDDIQAEKEGNRRAVGGNKGALLQQYMPIILLVIALAVGFSIYNQSLLMGKVDQIGALYNAMMEQIGRLK